MLSAVPQFTRNLVAPWNMFHIMCVGRDQGTVDDDLPNLFTLLGMELPYIEGGLSPGKVSQCCKEKGYRLLDNVTIRSPPSPSLCDSLSPGVSVPRGLDHLSRYLSSALRVELTSMAKEELY